MIPLKGFLEASPLEQIVFILCLVGVAYGIVHASSSDRMAFVGLLIVVGVFVLAIALMNFAVIRGAL